MHHGPSKKSRLALVRHGRSSHVHAGWITASGFRAWRSAYEAAGIGEDERVPSHLSRWLDPDAVVLCSDAPRAVASARLLAPSRELIISPLLRELELEGPALGRLRLPLLGWAVAVGVRALLLRLRRRYPSRQESARIDDAAALIDQLSLEHPQVVAITHASFRRLLRRRLLQRGWQRASRHRSVQHWSAWLLTREPTAPGSSEP